MMNNRSTKDIMVIKYGDKTMLSNIPVGHNYQDNLNNIIRTMIKNNCINKDIVSYCGYMLTKEFYTLSPERMTMVLKSIVCVGSNDTYIRNCKSDNDLYHIAGAKDKEEKLWLRDFLKTNNIVKRCVLDYETEKRYYVNPYIFKDISDMLMKGGINDLLFKPIKRIRKIKSILTDKVVEIYKITNLINNKLYIGQTTRGINVRFQEHCLSDSKVGRAIRKYGKENFCVELMATTNDPNKADLYETRLIKELDSFKNGYNATKTGRGIRFM